MRSVGGIAAGCLLAGAMWAAGQVSSASAAALISYGEADVFTKLCTVSGPACGLRQPSDVVYSYGGGYGVDSAGVSLPQTGSAEASGSFVGPLAAPLLKSASVAASDPAAWSLGSATMLQSYTWTGAAPMALSFEALLDYELEQVAGYDGLAGVLASFWIVETSFIDTTAHPLANIYAISNLLSGPNVDPCEADGVIGAATFSDFSRDGSFTAGLSLANDCAGNPLTVAPGQEFYMFAGLTTSAVFGARADASHTLTVDLSPDVSEAARAEIIANLRPTTPAAVPEPATWAMLIIGFGAVGSMVRRSRQAARA